MRSWRKKEIPMAEIRGIRRGAPGPASGSVTASPAAAALRAAGRTRGSHFARCVTRALPPPGPPVSLLFQRRRCDGETLRFLVVSPLLRVVVGHLHHIVRGLL